MENRDCRISVIVPAIGEQAVINATIAGLRRLPGGRSAEIIVVDGSPRGETLAAIRDAAVLKVRSPRGRGTQQNRGAAAAGGDILLFLHADTRLPPAAFARIAATLEGGDCAGGAFGLRIDSPRRAFRVIEAAANRRSRLTRIPYGDQAIFLRAAFFRALGGFAEIPLMEDVDLMRRVKRAGGRIVLLDDPVLTSARRWEKEGVLYGTLRNWLLVSLYLSGVAPERLVRFYR